MLSNTSFMSMNAKLVSLLLFLQTEIICEAIRFSLSVSHVPHMPPNVEARRVILDTTSFRQESECTCKRLCHLSSNTTMYIEQAGACRAYSM